MSKSFLPLFRKLAMKALNYERANNAFRDLLQSAPEEQQQEISHICDEIALKMKSSSNLEQDRALQALFSELQTMDFVKTKHTWLAAKIQDIFNLADAVARKKELQALLANKDVQKVFAEMTQALAPESPNFSQSFAKLGAGNFEALAGMLQRSADQIAYSPESMAISGLIKLFFQVFDMAEIVAGRKALFAREEQKPEGDKPRIIPMPSG
jgi:hypothetical protein